ATDSAAIRYPDADLAAVTKRLYDNLVTFQYLNDNNLDAQDSRAVAGGMFAGKKDRQVQTLSRIRSRRGQDPHHADRSDPAAHSRGRCGDRCCGNPRKESGRGTDRESRSGAAQSDRV